MGHAADQAVGQRVAIGIGRAERDQHRLFLRGRHELPQRHRRTVGADHLQRHRGGVVAAVLVGRRGHDVVVAVQRIGVAGAGGIAGELLDVAVAPVDLPLGQRVGPRVAGGQRQHVGITQVDLGRACHHQRGCQVVDRNIEAARGAAVAVTDPHHDRHRGIAVGGGPGEQAAARVHARARGATDQAVGQRLAFGVLAQQVEADELAFIDRLVGHRRQQRRVVGRVDGQRDGARGRGQGARRVGIVATAVGDRVGEAVGAEIVGRGQVGPHAIGALGQTAVGRCAHQREGQPVAGGFLVVGGQHDLHRRVLRQGDRLAGRLRCIVDGGHVEADGRRAGAELAVVDLELEAVRTPVIGRRRVGDLPGQRVEPRQKAMRRVAGQAEAQRVAIGIAARQGDQHAAVLLHPHRLGVRHRQGVAGAVDGEHMQVVATGGAVGVTVQRIAGGVVDGQRARETQPVQTVAEHAAIELQREVGLGEGIGGRQRQFDVVLGVEQAVGAGKQQLVVGRAAGRDAIQRLAEGDLHAGEGQGRAAPAGRQLGDAGDRGRCHVAGVALELIGADVEEVQARRGGPGQRIGRGQVAGAIVRCKHEAHAVARGHAHARREAGVAGAVVEAVGAIGKQRGREIRGLGRVALQRCGPSEGDLVGRARVDEDVAPGTAGGQVVPEWRDDHVSLERGQAVGLVDRRVRPGELQVTFGGHRHLGVGGAIELEVESERLVEIPLCRLVRLGHPAGHKTVGAGIRGHIQRPAIAAVGAARVVMAVAPLDVLHRRLVGNGCIDGR